MLVAHLSAQVLSKPVQMASYIWTHGKKGTPPSGMLSQDVTAIFMSQRAEEGEGQLMFAEC